ncbi:MAG: TetR/AcrR family transcriptional regulator C-terminal domain-containing protein [Sphingomonadaceae bacterium]
MKRLSARLGVGIATVYRYVSDRDELVRLALARRAYRPFTVEAGQHWADIVRGYAASLFSAISQDSYMLTSYMDGGYGVALEVELVERFLAALAERGFEHDDAARLCRTIGHLVGGAAMAHIHHLALHAAGTDRARRLAAAISDHDADELPHVRLSAGILADEDAASAWQPGIELLIRGIAARNGEAYPATA